MPSGPAPPSEQQQPPPTAVASAAAREHHHQHDPPPSSVEEAGALLGAAITRCGTVGGGSSSSSHSSNYDVVSPPPGMHSSFGTVHPAPGGELFVKLACLRALLRRHAGYDAGPYGSVAVSAGGGDEEEESSTTTTKKKKKKEKSEPLQAAPGLLAVLTKLLGVSSSLACSSSSAGVGAVVGAGVGGPKEAAAGVAASIRNAAVSAKTAGGIGALSTASSASSSASGGLGSGANSPDRSRHSNGGFGGGPPGASPPPPPPPPIPPIPPPMLSTPLRRLWADCVVLCNALGPTTSSSGGGGGGGGGGRVDPYRCLRAMMELAGSNPRSARAAGGTRLAALEVISGFFRDPTLSPRVAPWALEVFHLCARGLRSSGHGEPYYRAACVKAACAAAEGCQVASVASMKLTGRTDGVGTFLCRGALEDRAIVEAVKLLKRAADDKYPEVRSGAATLASLLSSMLVHSKPVSSSSSVAAPMGGVGGSAEVTASPLVSLDEVMAVALRNLDDESAGVASAWAEALARCICASIEYGENTRAALSADSASKRNAEGDEGPAENDAPKDLASKLKAFSEARKVVITSSCSSVSTSLTFLIDGFLKCGGELAASRCGGSYSSGGRAARAGYSAVIVEFLKLQCVNGGIGPNGISTTEALKSIFKMVGPVLEKQLQTPEIKVLDSLDATSSPNVSPEKTATTTSSLFRQSGRLKSPSDAGNARLATSRVIRRGLSEIASEQTQLSLFRELTVICQGSAEARSDADRLSGDGASDANRHQIQVALIELSHLITALGEAAASSLEDLIPVLRGCLSHSDHGVRHEAAVAYMAIAQSFPNECRKFIIACLDGMQSHIDAMQTFATQTDTETVPTPKRRFRRHGHKSKVATAPTSLERSLQHQYVIHGHALVISMLLHELPHLPGGVAVDIISKIIHVAELLLTCQYDQPLAKANSAAACTCVRAGYGMISGVLTLGPKAVSSHLPSIFTWWQRSCKSAEESTKHFSPSHDLICLEAVLSSIVLFLKYCSELLLAIPDALNRTTLLLEQLSPVIAPGGRLGNKQENPSAASRLESAKASIMEAYSWLPPGSFPLAADQIFSFAASHINSGSEEDVACSILPCLINSEDKLLDAHSVCRATAVGQVGGAVAVEENLVARKSDPAHHGEREAVLNLFARKDLSSNDSPTADVFGSPILKAFHVEQERDNPPTPLHEVGTWREPPAPSSSSKIRLIDAAVHVFAATFGLQDGQTQARAVRMLEDIFNSSLVQNTGRFSNVSASLISESQGRVKPKEESVAAINVTATLLACLKALPLHEATHDTLIGIGPPWMNRATDLLLTLLPSPSDLVRRAAAEGLALLATLGVSEDAHTLQSKILHALDEVMQGNAPDGSKRLQGFDMLPSARAGSLLTLACVQRAARGMAIDEEERSRARSSRSKNADDFADSSPPFMIMMTRILPSLATRALEGDSFLVRTYALHSFCVIIANSITQEEDLLSGEQVQILRKGVEAVENNFLAAWTAVTADYDKGREGEKFGIEAAFLSVLLRFMTFLLPWLHRLSETDPCIASRFSSMASTILEWSSSHPTVIFESVVFFERLSTYQSLLSHNTISVVFTENAVASSIPLLLSVFKPSRPQGSDGVGEMEMQRCYGSITCQRAAVMCLRRLLSNGAVLASTLDSSILHAHLYLYLEQRCGLRHFEHAAVHRTVSASRETERTPDDCRIIETELLASIESLLLLEGKVGGEYGAQRLLRWLLFSRALLAGASESRGEAEDGDELTNEVQFSVSAVTDKERLLALQDAFIVLQHITPSRWQVKCEAAKTAAMALSGISELSRRQKKGEMTPHFDLILARSSCSQRCREANNRGGVSSDPTRTLPCSYAAFYVEELVAVAAGAATATSDQAELPSLQNSGLRFLTSLVEYFGDAMDPSFGDGSALLLDQFSSQIISSVKHSMKGESQDDESIICAGSHLLFASGCEALQMIIKKKLVSDSVVLKRLVRPIVPSSTDIPFCGYPQGEGGDSRLRVKPVSLFDDALSLPLYRILKLATLSKLRLLKDINKISDSLGSALVESTKMIHAEIGAHSAAFALDAARILYADKMSLCGVALSDETDDEHQSLKAGLTFANAEDIDDAVKVGMIQSWPSLAASAVSLFVNDLTVEESGGASQHEGLLSWLDKIVPLIFQGLHDSLTALDDGSDATKIGKELPQQTAVTCLHAARIFFRAEIASVSNLQSSSMKELDALLPALVKTIILPSLGLPGTWGREYDAACDIAPKEDQFLMAFGYEDGLVLQACAFLEDICLLRTKREVGASGKTLSRAALLPLLAFQEGKVTFQKDAHVEISIVLASSLRCCQLLLIPAFNADDDDIDKVSLARALLQSCLQLLSSSADRALLAKEVKEAASVLLCTCLEASDHTAEGKRRLARDAAMLGSWEAWELVCAKLEGGSGFISSIGCIQDALLDLKDIPRHAAALAAVKQSAQEKSSEHSTFIGDVMQGVGAEVLQLLKLHGVASAKGSYVDVNRIMVCADAMKVIMMAFQHLISSEESNPAFEESEVSSFLGVVFAVLVDVIRFNGLPNHHSQKSGADESIGRMCAQAFVHVARSAPAAFKATLMGMADEDRGVLEMSVRADMSGYAPQRTTAPVKKKLNLKGFSK